MSLAFGSTFAATIGDNFDAGGYSLGGFASYYSQDTYSSFYLAPSVSFYPKQNVATSVGVAYNSWGNEDKAHDTEFFGGLSYAFGYDPMATKGLVHNVGFNASAYQYTDSTGTKYDMSIRLTPYYRADYFLNEHVSVYGRARLFDVNLTSAAGETVTNYFYVSSGISVHFPNSFGDWTNILK